jgi:hypothetical protein
MQVQVEERQARWHWRDIQLDALVDFPTEEPAQPEIGCAWYDAAEHCLCIWDGIEWVCVPLD